MVKTGKHLSSSKALGHSAPLHNPKSIYPYLRDRNDVW